MGFWNCLRFSWGLLCLLVMLTSAGPALEEPVAPWLLHPLRPPSPLRLGTLFMTVDYRTRLRPGWVSLESSLTLENPTAQVVEEQLLVCCSDPDAQLVWKGRPVAADHLVMPLPGKGERTMARVSVFRLILLGHEKGTLRFQGMQRLEFLSAHQHRVGLLNLVPGAWQSAGDSQLTVYLTPELKLLATDFEMVNQAWRRKVDRHHANLGFRAEARWDPSPRVLQSVPALWSSLQWAALAALAGVSTVALGRFGWTLSLPTSLILWCSWLETTGTLGELNYYRDGRIYAGAELKLGYTLAAIVLVACLVGKMLRRDGKESSSNA